MSQPSPLGGEQRLADLRALQQELEQIALRIQRQKAGTQNQRVEVRPPVLVIRGK